MGLFKKYRFFWRTQAPASLYFLYPMFSLGRRLSKKADQETISKVTKELNGLGHFNSIFFDDHAAQWIKVFEREQLKDQKLRILEIGSWEGRSTVFMLHYFPNAEITCVDTWKGSDEHVGDMNLGGIEELFDSNVKQFGERVRKCKGSSLQYFAEIDLTPQFDLVYVDGSHHADDVVGDVVNGFRCLKSNGLMICDDFLWNWYPEARDNPAIAIHYLLNQKKSQRTILNVTGFQIFIKKQ